jgi:hypothetical protein
VGQAIGQVLSLGVGVALSNAAIMAVLCLVIGAKLIGDGISGLT